MKIPNPSQMMDAHIRMNLGVYFDNLIQLSGFCVATSKRIKDYYWNYAYFPNTREICQNDLNAAILCLAEHNRGVAIWKEADTTLPSGWAVQSEEAWMWLEREEWQTQQGIDISCSLDVRSDDIPNEKMRAVFQDAYSSGGDENDIGYFDLPSEYGEAYLMARAKAPTQICHFSGWLGDQCVAIATASVWNGYGGIYSVATTHEHRNRGFGTQISRHAVRWAFVNGASGVMLQTSVNSLVEKMYTKLGFHRTHVGTLLAPATD